MKEEDLLADVTPLLIFVLAALVFAVGWLNTGQGVLLAGALLLGIGVVYQLYRLRTVYLE